MSPKAQHAAAYRKLPFFLRSMREQAGLTQRALGAKIGKPQSWIHNCEVSNRRVDMMEFAAWAKSCGVDPVDALKWLLEGD